MVDDDTRMTAHAYGSNEFTQGKEIKAENLYGYTPIQMEHAIYIDVQFCRKYNYPINRTTISSHYAMDLITTNPYYNPAKGTFSTINGNPPTIRKNDPPQELVDAMIAREQALDAELGPR
jgi:hypothetical protein